MTATNRTGLFILIGFIVTGVLANTVAAMPDAAQEQDYVSGDGVSKLTGNLIPEEVYDTPETQDNDEREQEERDGDVKTRDASGTSDDGDGSRDQGDGSNVQGDHEIEDGTDAGQNTGTSGSRSTATQTASTAMSQSSVMSMVQDVTGDQMNNVKQEVHTDLRQQLTSHIDQRVEQEMGEASTGVKQDVRNDLRQQLASHIDQRVAQKTDEVGAGVKQEVHSDLQQQLTSHIEQRIGQELDQLGESRKKDREVLKDWIRTEYGDPAQSHDEIRERLKQVEDGTMTEEAARQHIKVIMEQHQSDLQDDLEDSRKKMHEQQKQELKQWLNGKIPEGRYDELDDRLKELEKQDDRSGWDETEKQELKQWIKTQIPEHDHNELDARFDDLDTRVDDLDTTVNDLGHRVSALEDRKLQGPGVNESAVKDWIDMREAHVLKSAKQYTDEQTQMQEQNRQDIEQLKDQFDALSSLATDLDGLTSWIKQEDNATLQKSQAYTDQRETAIKDWVDQRLGKHGGKKETVPKHGHAEYAPKNHEHPEYVTHDELDGHLPEQSGAPGNGSSVDESRIVAQTKQYVDSRISSVQSGISRSHLRNELVAFRDWAENRYARQDDVVELARQNEQLRREVEYLKEAVNQTVADTGTAAQVMAAHNYTEFHYGDTQCKVREKWNGDRVVQCVR